MRRTGRRARRERGVALLSALFAVALLTVIVIEMTDATMVHTHLTRNAGNAMAAQLLARSAEIAGEALLTNEDTNSSEVTCEDDLWAQPYPGLETGAGMVSLQIEDEGGKLDLNAIGDERYRAAVKQLFADLGLDPELVDAVAVWIAPASRQPMATGEASEYCALPMPCKPRNAPLRSLEELLLIRGFEPETLDRLRPFVTVVPVADGRSTGRPSEVNVNTAPWQVLSALGCEAGPDSLPPPCSARFGDEQQGEWRQDIEAWRTESCPDVPRNLLSTKSNLFSINAAGTVGDLSQTVRVLVRRSGSRAQRLAWQERPNFTAVPVEVR